MSKNEMPDLTTIKGLIATAVGVIFIVMSYSVILKTLLFVTGVVLVYYGIQMLNITALNHFLSTVKSHIKRFLP